MLTAPERAALQFEIVELIGADEPEAVLGVLSRIADRMSRRAVRRSDVSAAHRWVALYEALEAVRHRVKKMTV